MVGHLHVSVKFALMAHWVQAWRVSRHRKLSQRFASLNVTAYWCRDTISYFLSRSHHFR
jgi:hypothetical protein